MGLNLIEMQQRYEVVEGDNTRFLRRMNCLEGSQAMIDAAVTRDAFRKFQRSIYQITRVTVMVCAKRDYIITSTDKAVTYLHRETADTGITKVEETPDEAYPGILN